MIDVWTDPELAELDASLLAIADALVGGIPVRRRRPRVPAIAAAALVVLVAALVPAVALSKGLRAWVGLGTPSQTRVYASIVQWPPLDARPGTRVRITWELWMRPALHLDGSPVMVRPTAFLMEQRTFARIVAPKGTASTSAPGHFARGRYTAIVTVPPGGIGRLQFGKRVWRKGPNGNRLVAVLFPLRSSPFRTR